MTLHLENGKTLVIEVAGNSLSNKYIQSSTLNGRPFTRNYLTYKELTDGGMIKYVMGNQPAVNRGVLVEDRPYAVSK